MWSSRVCKRGGDVDGGGASSPFSRWSRRGGDRVPIVAGASAPTVDEVVSYARQALRASGSRADDQPPKSIGAGAGAVTAFSRPRPRSCPRRKSSFKTPRRRVARISLPEAVLEVVRRVAAVRYVKEETLPAVRRLRPSWRNAPEHLLGVSAAESPLHSGRVRSGRLCRHAGTGNRRSACRTRPQLP